MNSITQDTRQMVAVSQKMKDFFASYRIGHILHRANARKLAGIPVVQVFLFAFAMAFCSKSLYMKTKLCPGSLPFGKDTFYRFINSCHTNWRKFTTLLCASIIAKTIAPLTSEERMNVLIIDDSTFPRARSKKVELLARIYDHAHHLYTYGFRMMTLCWSDGNTVLPINHCLLSSTNQRNRLFEAHATVDARSNGAKQRTLAQMKGTRVVLELLKQAKEAGIPAKHVLFDSWFCTPSAMLDLKELGYFVIGMIKKSKTLQFRVNGKMQDVKTIYRTHPKRRGRAAWKLSVAGVAVKEGREVPVRLVYVANRNNPRDYLVLVTTDMSLREDEVIRNYGKRWGIEVFFKVCKSYLKLSKECRALSYDALTAHVSIVFTRYMMLAVQERECVDDRSLGELFFMSIDELADITLRTSLTLILLEVVREIDHSEQADSEMLADLVKKFIKSISNLLQGDKTVHDSGRLSPA